MYRNSLAAINVHLFVIIILKLYHFKYTEAFSFFSCISRTYSSIIMNLK
jgi:hypothetical protein